MSYNDVVARIQFWNTYNGNSTPVFSNAAGGLVTVDLGPITTAANNIYTINVTLNTPITLLGGPGTNWGFAQNFQGNTGSGLADTTDLTSLITSNTAGTYAAGQITTGTSPVFGYYRNAGGETDFNFASTDARSLTGLNGQGIGIIIVGHVVGGGPTPTPTATPATTATPTATPTVAPTATPTVAPTATPTATPTVAPTATPTATPTAAPTATPTPTPTPTGQTVNLSTRVRVLTGDNIGIGGFIITGSAPKHVIIRAIGPSLTQFGFTAAEVLPDPTLELHGPGAFVTQKNNNWRDTQEAQIQADGVPPTNDLESAIDATLAPGNYTALIADKNGASGVGVVEVYDLDTAADSKLANISTRAFVGTGGNVVIAGFILGSGAGNDRVLVVASARASLTSG